MVFLQFINNRTLHCNTNKNIMQYIMPLFHPKITRINEVVMYNSYFYVMKYNCIIINATNNSHMDIYYFSLIYVMGSYIIIMQFIIWCLFPCIHHFLINLWALILYNPNSFSSSARMSPYLQILRRPCFASSSAFLYSSICSKLYAGILFSVRYIQMPIYINI